MVNNQPTYFATKYFRRTLGGKLELVKGMFNVFEVRNGIAEFCFKMSNRGERLQNILKRGIPYDWAKTLFYQMDE